MKYVVAVSGGVDSTALLDVLVRGDSQLAADQLVVAHFDHGIREDSREDAAFVGHLAERYGTTFVTKREELGAGASEELARRRRYAFLRQVAGEHDARIITAHHADDIAETIAINLTRGTGWRGVAVLSSDIIRPFLGVTKQEIIDYANARGLEWREDSTNQDEAYLRNRLRTKLGETSDDTTWQLAALRSAQQATSAAIDDELNRLFPITGHYDRALFIQIPPRVAHEAMRHITGGRLTRPQAERALLAVKTLGPGKVYQAGGNIEITMTRRTFSVKVLK